MKRTVPLGRYTSIQGSGPLKPVSQKQARVNSAKQRAYKVVKARVQWCESCGSRQRLSPSHALTQKQWPQFAAEPRNIFILCWPCHYVFEHDKRRFAQLSPDVWARKLQIILELAPQQFQLLAMEYPDLIPES